MSIASVPVVRRRRTGPGALPYLLVAPGAVVVGCFTMIALLFTIIASFTNWDVGRLKWGFNGVTNYVRGSADPALIASLSASFVFVVAVVVLSVAIGFLIAVGLDRRFPGRALLRGIVVVPWVISELATGVFWSILLSTDGLLGQVFGAPLNSAGGAMTCLVLVEVWRSVGFVTVMVLASLQSIDRTLYEAAKIDGAGSARMIWNITVPLVSPALLIAAILLTVGNFNLVTMIIGLTGGGPISATTTTALYMYQQSFVYFHLGYGASIAVVMSILNVIAIVIFVALQRRLGGGR